MVAVGCPGWPPSLGRDALPFPGSLPCHPAMNLSAAEYMSGRHAGRCQVLSSDEASRTKSPAKGSREVGETPQHKAKITFPSPAEPKKLCRHAGAPSLAQ